MTTTDYRTKAERDAAERFASETAGHKMTVLHDEGLFRHLRFTGPTNELYWYEITTTPRQLVFSGDGDSFVFRLADDMFDVFRRSASSGGINASYWAEKIRTGNAFSYSEDRFRECVEKAVGHSEASYPGLRKDVESRIFNSDFYDVSYEGPACAAVLDYSYRLPEKLSPHREPFRFARSWEWKLGDYDWWYLFACHAIADGIAQYDAAKAPAAEAVAS
jgi:hypothetical protein